MWANYDDVLAQLQACGLDVRELEVDTARPKRCHEVDGDREKRGWYWLTTKRIGDADYVTGAFGVYHGNDNGKQVVKINRDGKAVQIDKAEREAIAARQREHMKRLKALRQAEIDRAAAEASACWRKYVEQGDSDYLQRKSVAAHGVRFSPSGNGTFAVPMMDPTGAVHGLQIVRGKDRKHKREKEYWPAGLSKIGHYHLIGGLPTWVVIVAEGYATAASIFEATGLPTVVAFDAGNLLPVAQVLHEAWPRCKILVAADDDYRTEGNPGIAAASNAAHAVGGSWVAPRFQEERPVDKKGPTDFNDLQALEGIATVRAQIQTHLAGLGWAAPEPRARDVSPQGGGETRRAQAVMCLEDAIARFVPLDDGTGKYLFDTWTNRVCLKDQMSAVLPASVRWDDVKRHAVWVERGAYFLHEVGFDPAGNDSTVQLNTWRGWPLQPRRGSCERMLELLEYLCSGEENAREVVDWLICWMAYPLQHPGAKMSSAVIMHGPQGTGKSTVFQALAKIYGDYSTVLNQRGLEDKFNSDWSDSKLFILAEEIVTRAEMWHIKNELKELVTGEWIRINPKNVAAYRQRNHINICYLSNETQPLPIENDDRRHLVVWTPPQLGEEFYDEVFLEMEQGGVEAFYQYLLDVDLAARKFHPKKRPPMTESKRRLIDLSAPSEARFCSDYLAGDTPWPVGPALTDDFYAAYLRWCRSNGENRPRPSNQFFGSVARIPGWEKSKRRVYEDCTFTGKTKPRPIVIPPLSALQSVGAAPPPGGDDAQWLTRRVYEFRRALSEKGFEQWAA